MTVVKSFIYSEGRKPIARVDRIEPGRGGGDKEFLPYLALPTGGFATTPGLHGTKLPLYGVDEVRSAIEEGKTVYIVEGEGKCDKFRVALRLAGDHSAVTTIQGGARAPMLPRHVASLKGAPCVILLADSDESGRRAARSRAQRVAEVYPKCDVRIVDFYSDRDDGADVADWLDDGHTIIELAALVEAASPVAPSSMLTESQALGEAVSPGHEATLDIVRLADVPAEQVEWIWCGRIPIGKVTLLVGDPGAGKSFASLAIAACITNGMHLPDDDTARDAGSVLLWNGEDGIADTIRPRAEALGVDLDRMHVIRGGLDERGEPRPFALRDVPGLYEELNRIGDVRMVAIDPLSALLAGVDTHRDAEVRSTLQPLIELARIAHVAVIVVLHLRKGEAERMLYRIGGSIGFVAMARSVLLVDEDENGRHAIAPMKSNLSAAPLPVEFSIDNQGQWWWGKTNGDLSADRLLTVNRAERSRALDTAIEFFQEALAAGERDAKEVSREADDLGIPRKTQERARKKLRVEARRVGGLGDKGKWVIGLPKSAKNVSSSPDRDSGLSGYDAS